MKILKKNSLPFFKKIIPILLIIFIVNSFFWKFFLNNEAPIPGDFIVGVYYPWLDYKWGTTTGIAVKNPITTDVVSFTYPMQTLAMTLLKKGVTPLWNPYILAGSPLFANFQSAPFAPTSFVYFIFDNFTSWSLQVILQHILAAIFTYFLLRHWKVSKIASIFGGIIFAFSGYNLIFSQWNGHTLASAFIPLVLLFEDRFIKKRKYGDGFGMSLSLALQFFSGYTQTSLYTGVAIGLLWIVNFQKNKEFFKTTIFLGFFCLAALALSAVQILPSLELIKNSQREFEPHPFEWAFLPWKKIITFVAPDFFGNHVTRNYWGPQDYTSNTGFVGVVALILTIISVKIIRKKKHILFLFILLIVSLLLSFPTPISIFIWSQNILGMKANSAHRATILFCTSISFLSAFGYDLINTKLKLKSKLISMIIPLVILIGAIVYAFLVREKQIFGISVALVGIKNLILSVSILITSSIILIFTPKAKFLLILLAILEIFYFGWKFTPFSPRDYVFPETPILNFLESQPKPFRVTGAKVIPSNMRMAYSLETPEGYDTFHPLNMSRFVAAINSGNTKSVTGRYGIVDNDISPLLDLINTKYYLALKSDPNLNRFDSKRFKKIFEDKSVLIFESKNYLPRAFMVYDWEIEKDDIKALNKLLDPKYPFSQKIILNSEVNSIKPSKISDNKINYLKYSEQESILSVESKNDGMLFVSDSYYPGWHAYIDNTDTKIIKSDIAFRSIAIPQGKHIVKFIYKPDSFNNGLKISLISLILLFAIFVIYTRLKSLV
ncbi:MAG: YfhO family protein [Candidatus Woesebacteria bacterium]|nr:MAG: YfhO family protein [Candidatus Woesebacteria bacterium]